jgi:hypothetical protein
MKMVQGVIEKILFKPFDEPDQYENTGRLSIKVGDDWVGFGPSKKAEINIKKGTGWEKVEEGDEVALMCEESEWNGKIYLNGKKSQIKVVKKGTGSPTKNAPAAPSSAARGSGAGAVSAKSASANNGVDWAAKDAGGAASASIDKAIAYYQLQGNTGVSLDNILDIARQFQVLVKTLAHEIQHGDKSEQAFEKAYSPPAETPKPLTSGMPGKTPGSRGRSAPKPVEPEGDFVDSDLDLF